MSEIQQARDSAQEPQELNVWLRAVDIYAARHDDEHAHNLEDALYLDVLRAIADGAPNAAELARDALRTQEINFSRNAS